MVDTISRSVDQLRAEFAWQQVAAHAGAEAYREIAKGAPALVMSNGLMQALLYLEDKGKGAKEIAGDVLKWLGKQGLVRGVSFSDQLGSLASSEAEAYMLATQEALEILRWIKQFASALLKS